VPESRDVNPKIELKPAIDDSSIKDENRRFDPSYRSDIPNPYPGVELNASDP
jgi:hypothetical protein